MHGSKITHTDERVSTGPRAGGATWVYNTSGEDGIMDDPTVGLTISMNFPSLGALASAATIL
jgi:hypothetical protein